MDPLSTTASVIAVVQITSQFFGLCQTYFQGVKSARKDVKRLRDEVTAFQDVLVVVGDLADNPDSAQLSNLHLLTNADGLVDRCKGDLEDLVKKLQTGMGKDEKMRQLGLRALKWPFSSKDVDRELVILSRYKETFGLALTTDLTTLAVSIKQCISELKQDSTDIRRNILAMQTDLAAHKTDRDRNRIIQWLSTSDPSFNHEKACQKHEPTTGNWLLGSLEFKKWRTTRNSLLWLHGIPGCGKTILSSTIIKHLMTELGPRPETTVLYYYFDFADVKKQRPSDSMSSIIAQFFHRFSKLPEVLIDLHKRCNDGDRQPTLRELSTLFTALVRLDSLADIYIVLDALDECPQDEINGRNELLTFISTMLAFPTSSLHILVTSRPEIDIKEALEALNPMISIPLQGAGVDADIRLHIKNQLAADVKFKSWSHEIESEIREVLTTGAKVMFRWVFCQLDALKKCKKATSVRKALTSLPKSLDDTYERIIANISEEYRHDARRALVWIGFSKRPLRLREVAEAAVFKGDAEFDHEDRFRNPTDILEILGSLVTCSVEDRSDGHAEHIGDPQFDSWNRDFMNSLPSDEWRLVSLAHYSVMEYLKSDRVINEDFGISEDKAHKIIVEGCLDYISQYDKSSAKTTSREDLRCFPLLYYACKFWHIHFEAVSQESQIPIRPLLRRLFLSPTELSSLVRIHRPDRWWLPPFSKGYESSSPLYYSASIGLQDVVQLLLDEGADVDATNEIGWTALLVATYHEREPLVQLLLQNKADPNRGDLMGNRALHAAVLKSNVAITRRLLEHTADPDVRDASGNIALHRAVFEADELMMQTLLEFKANINALNQFRQTALHVAVYHRNEAIARLLIENGADVHALSANNDTPLHVAVKKEQVSIVRLLLEHGINIEAKNRFGRTPLYYATVGGLAAVRNLLLEHGADLTQDYKGGIREDMLGGQWTSDEGSETSDIEVEISDEYAKYSKEGRRAWRRRRQLQRTEAQAGRRI